MDRTEVFLLDTEQDVVEFCEHLLELKSEAPVSLKYMIALTILRSVTVVEPFDGSQTKIGSAFKKLIAGK
jgi:hypothetical protein